MIEPAAQVSSTVKQSAPVEVVDLLATRPSTLSFTERVCLLSLSKKLEDKAIKASQMTSGKKALKLSPDNEKELATEVLLLRHRFTELVYQSALFSQAALTIIQNIYLFRNRKIFFDPAGAMYEKERKEALHLFSSRSETHSLPLCRTFQHLIIARVWNRITCNATQQTFVTPEFNELEEVVQRLNTIRNIYVLLCTGLVRTITATLGDVYKESLTADDAYQVGCFGVARASYRYHQSSGIRFSTYAGNWIKKEIQRQSLSGRLIRISSNTVEQYALARKADNPGQLEFYTNLINNTTCLVDRSEDFYNLGEPSTPVEHHASHQERHTETKELKRLTNSIITTHLSEKEADIIQRRFALSPYEGSQQSIIDIAEFYGVTRSAIYQIEKSALAKLHRVFRTTHHEWVHY